MSAIGELAHGERQKDEGRDNKAGYAFLAPWLIGLVVITVGPMLASLYLSFTNYPCWPPPVSTASTTTSGCSTTHGC